MLKAEFANCNASRIKIKKMFKPFLKFNILDGKICIYRPKFRMKDKGLFNGAIVIDFERDKSKNMFLAAFIYLIMYKWSNSWDVFCKVSYKYFAFL